MNPQPALQARGDTNRPKHDIHAKALRRKVYFFFPDESQSRCCAVGLLTLRHDSIQFF